MCRILHATPLKTPAEVRSETGRTALLHCTGGGQGQCPRQTQQFNTITTIPRSEAPIEGTPVTRKWVDCFGLHTDTVFSSGRMDDDLVNKTVGRGSGSTTYSTYCSGDARGNVRHSKSRDRHRELASRGLHVVARILADLPVSAHVEEVGLVFLTAAGNHGASGEETA